MTAISEKRVPSHGGWAFTVNTAECVDGLLQAIEAAAGGKIPGTWSRLESSANSLVWKFSFNARDYVYKEFAVRGVLDTLKSAVKGSRARRAWIGSEMIEECGLNAPARVAYGEKTKGTGRGKSILVTRHVPGAIGIFTLLMESERYVKGSNRSAIKRNVASALGRVIGKMHAAGVAHGDLRLNNIMVTKWDSKSPVFYFIDNERNSKKACLSTAAIVKNLVAVSMIGWLSKGDRLAFLNSYLECMPELKKRKKEIAVEVGRQAKERVLKKHGRDIFDSW